MNGMTEKNVYIWIGDGQKDRELSSDQFALVSPLLQIAIVEEFLQSYHDDDDFHAGEDLSLEDFKGYLNYRREEENGHN